MLGNPSRQRFRLRPDTNRPIEPYHFHSLQALNYYAEFYEVSHIAAKQFRICPDDSLANNRMNYIRTF